MSRSLSAPEGRHAAEPPRSNPRRKRAIVSPGGMLAIAAVLGAALAVMHVLGWRQHVGFLSGSVPTGAGADVKLALGATYALTWFAAILGVPILVLAAGLFAVLLRLLPAKGRADTHAAAGRRDGASQCVPARDVQDS